MPSVNVAMERSLRRGAADLFAASLRPWIEKRGLTDSANDFKNSFSSWDNCMNATYCKWPVIAIMVVGGLIILSVVICLVRCLCLGMSCCCSCFACLKCCGNCCGCCDPPKGTPHKHLDDPYHAPPTQGYHAQAPMTAGPPVPVASGAAYAPAFAPATSHHEPPKYVEFDVSKKRDDDSLPAMPTWDDSANRKVMVEETVEMEPLKKPMAAASASNLNLQTAPLMRGQSPGPASPVNPNYRPGPYGGHENGVASAPYLGGAASQDPYGRGPQQGYNNYGDSGAYAQSTGALDHGYGAAGAMGMGQGRHTPANNHRGNYGPGPSPSPSPGPVQGMGGSYDDYGAPNGYGMGRRPSAPPQQGAGYGYNGMPDRSGSVPPPPVGYDGGYNDGYDSRRPQQAAYSSAGNQGDYYDGRPSHDRQYSPLNGQQHIAPVPQRNFSNNIPSGPPSPLQNNSGFDFNSGSSRPQEQGYDDGYGGRQQQPVRQNTTGGGYGNERPFQPPSRQNTGGSAAAYPGFKAYQPDSRGQQQQPYR